MPTSSFPVRETPGSGPLPILRPADLRALEARHANDGLMERAGRAAANTARAMLAGGAGRVVVIAGPGNNGGDAFVVARLLASWFYDVVTVFRGDPAQLPPDASAAHAAFVAAGGRTTPNPPVATPSLVVDGLFGIGLSRPPAPNHAALIEWANDCGAPILALDVPSGIDAATGACFSPVVRAQVTITFIALKPGLLTGAGAENCGRVELDTLGIGIDGPAVGRRLDWSALASGLPRVLRRDARDVHKGTFGTLAIVGGADGMVGAPILAGRASMKAGAGKVLIGFAADAAPTVDWQAPELMLRNAAAALDAGADAVVIGPGLSTSAHAYVLLQRAIAVAAPLVVDADGLNLVAQDEQLRAALRDRRAPTLLTPHPAEAARLLATDAKTVAADRLGAATRLAREFNAGVVLKGSGSVLVYADGAFDINGTGGPALATAGSGDVLAGILGAFLAQRFAARDALRYAVCLHGAAADRLVANGIGPVGLAASEIADAARALINAAATADASQSAVRDNHR